MVAIADRLTHVPFRLRGLPAYGRPTPDVTHHVYYNDNWQAVEVREGTNTEPLDQYVWDQRYIDAGSLGRACSSAVRNCRLLQLRPGAGTAVSSAKPNDRFHDGNSDGDYADAGDNTLYYTTDANHNVTAVIGTDGTVTERYAYNPYGEATVLDADWSSDADGLSDVDNAVLFTGKRLDPNCGLYYYNRRWYDAALGRFITRDPKGYIDGPNLYQYCGSNPTNATDPMGTAPEPNWSIKLRPPSETKSLRMSDVAFSERMMNEAYNRSAFHWDRRGEKDVSIDHTKANRYWWSVYEAWKARLDADRRATNSKSVVVDQAFGVLDISPRWGKLWIRPDAGVYIPVPSVSFDGLQGDLDPIGETMRSLTTGNVLVNDYADEDEILGHVASLGKHDVWVYYGHTWVKFPERKTHMPRARTLEPTVILGIEEHDSAIARLGVFGPGNDLVSLGQLQTAMKSTPDSNPGLVILGSCRSAYYERIFRENGTRVTISLSWDTSQPAAEKFLLGFWQQWRKPGVTLEQAVKRSQVSGAAPWLIRGSETDKQSTFDAW